MQKLQLTRNQAHSIATGLTKTKDCLRDLRYQFLTSTFARELDRDTVRVLLQDIITQAQLALGNTERD